MLNIISRPTIRKYPGKDVYWLVLTGGPCSGKTTALSLIERNLRDKGYKVFTIDEGATRIINSGIKHDEFDNYVFQNYIAYEQIASEVVYDDVIQKTNYDKIVILCDRGFMDLKAYCNPGVFERILENFNLNEEDVKNSYDGVIHLVTAASGAEKYYTLANNKARRETLEEARIMDKQTMNAWYGHPHFKIIDNSTNFKRKMERIMENIYYMLGEPIPIDSYNKYLVSLPNNFEESLNELNATQINITRIYLKNDDNNNERSVLKRGNKGEYSFYYTEKKHYPNFDRIEVEKRITEKEYLSFISLENTPIKQLDKCRYCFVWYNKYYELDTFSFWKDKALLKIQLTNRASSSFEIPTFLNVIKDVTGNTDYLNYSLAQRVPD